MGVPDPESLSGGHYTPSEELEVFISWGNELMRRQPEQAQAIIDSAIERSVFPPQIPLPDSLVRLDLELSKDSRQK